MPPFFGSDAADATVVVTCIATVIIVVGLLVYLVSILFRALADRPGTRREGPLTAELAKVAKRFALEDASPDASDIEGTFGGRRVVLSFVGSERTGDLRLALPVDSNPAHMILTQRGHGASVT